MIGASVNSVNPVNSINARHSNKYEGIRGIGMKHIKSGALRAFASVAMLAGIGMMARVLDVAYTSLCVARSAVT